VGITASHCFRICGRHIRTMQFYSNIAIGQLFCQSISAYCCLTGYCMAAVVLTTLLDCPDCFFFLCAVGHYNFPTRKVLINCSKLFFIGPQKSNKFSIRFLLSRFGPAATCIIMPLLPGPFFTSPPSFLVCLLFYGSKTV